mgnify:CR=1 FL=1
MPKSIYQRLFESWPEPRLIIIRNDDGMFRVEFANTLACDYFMQPHGGLDGQLLDPLLDAANKHHIIQSFDVCFSSGLPIQIQVIPMLPDGVRMRAFYLNPLKDDDGKVVAIDMGARLTASSEDLLRRERDDAISIFTSIFDASDVGIVVTDHHGRIVRVNTTFCFNYGWDPIDLIGYEFIKLLPEDDHAFARKRHDEFMTDAPIEKSREIKIISKKGDTHNVIASSGVIELSGTRKFRISTVVDITNLKKVEQDLRKAKEVADAASHAKSAFLANMSHELRTPLNAIIGFSDLMVTGTLGPVENPHYLEYLNDIRFSARHLLSIINDVLDMSKIEAGHMKLDIEPADMAGLLEEAARLLRAKAQESSVSLETRISDDVRAVSVDARMIRQVLLNLISNAVKFSPKGGRVVISAKKDGDDSVLLMVEDSGIGIPADKIQEVLQPFGQVSDPRINKGQGTGLGLPLARAMMELHGGSLSIASQPEKGTTVTCRLPVVA